MKIKNWEKFQHYQTGKNAPKGGKSPEWIKLYPRKLLDDMEWHALDPLDAKVLLMLWMLASENGGALPRIEVIAFRLRLTTEQITSVLSRLPHWIEGVPDDVPSAVLGQSYEVSRPEEEREEKKKEKKLRKEKNAPNGAAPAFENWNTMAEHLSLQPIRALTADRIKKMKAIMGAHGLDGWNTALRNIAEMPFCCGQNDRQWRVTIDWLLKPANFVKILEKAYEKPEAGHGV